MSAGAQWRTGTLAAQAGRHALGGQASRPGQRKFPELLIRLARSGAGITMLSDHFAEPYVRSGELEQLLADWSLPAVSAWAIFPGRRLMPTRTRVFLDAMLAEFSGPRCQQRQAQIDQGKSERRFAGPGRAPD